MNKIAFLCNNKNGHIFSIIIIPLKAGELFLHGTSIIVIFFGMVSNADCGVNTVTFSKFSASATAVLNW